MKNKLLLLVCLNSLLFLGIGCQSTNSSIKKASTGSFTDLRDQQTYTTIKIGSQVWMAENLRYAAENSWLNPKNPRLEYGRLYNWETAKNACPNGWRLPSDEDWKVLEVTLGMPREDADLKGWRGREGITLKSKMGWKGKRKGNNRSGFNILPSGDCSPTGKFLSLGESTSFWTATSKEASSTWNRHFDARKDGVNRYTNNTKMGLSCRCIKN